MHRLVQKRLSFTNQDEREDKLGDPLGTPKKKCRRFCHYDPNWETQAEFKNWIRKCNDEYSVGCSFCNSVIKIQYEGKRALVTHIESKKHKIAENAKSKANSMKNYVRKSDSLEELQVIKIEVASIYHNIAHGHSYASLDCHHKLVPFLFKDSSLAKQISCGRTKSTAIAASVLGPAAESMLIKRLHKSKYFSIASDASNKGNSKMFPYAVQYFDKDTGIQQGLLDFYEDPHEGSADIFQQIVSTTTKCGLLVTNVSAYSADNAPVNYGCKNSVYQKLSEINPAILSANCKCHILHNTVKAACNALSMDVENLVLKVYSEFSHSALRVEKLKEFAEFVEIEYKSILRHVSTRWLTLGDSLDRILLNWPALKSLFLSTKFEDCPGVINQFIGRSSKNDEETSMEEGVGECYMYFMQNILQEFQSRNLKLQGRSCTATDVFQVMAGMVHSLEDRKRDCFYGSKANCISKLLPRKQQKLFISDANTFLQRAIEYLKSHFDFSNRNIFSKMKFLSLSATDFQATFSEFTNLANELKIDVLGDQLYHDFCNLRANYKDIDKADDVDKRWVSFFKIIEAPELLKLVSFVLSIPVSNAYAERVFSLLKRIWSDSRNPMSVSLIKAELQIKLNYELSCGQFLEYLGKAENKSLLLQARSSRKYND